MSRGGQPDLPAGGRRSCSGQGPRLPRQSDRQAVLPEARPVPRLQENSVEALKTQGPSSHSQLRTNEGPAPWPRSCYSGEASRLAEGPAPAFRPTRSWTARGPGETTQPCVRQSRPASPAGGCCKKSPSALPPARDRADIASHSLRRRCQPEGAARGMVRIRQPRPRDSQGRRTHSGRGGMAGAQHHVPGLTTRAASEPAQERRGRFFPGLQSKRGRQSWVSLGASFVRRRPPATALIHLHALDHESFSRTPKWPRMLP